jgi:hypothetical protein
VEVIDPLSPGRYRLTRAIDVGFWLSHLWDLGPPIVRDGRQGPKLHSRPRPSAPLALVRQAITKRNYILEGQQSQ